MSSDSRTRPLRTAFLLTSMPVGGAETLLVNLVRRLDARVITPQIVCLKELGELGAQVANEFAVSTGYSAGKWDLRVLPRLTRFFREQELDAVVTVGAGDKMFWGRIAARAASVPVVVSALHSTGWPDGIGHLNRLLTSWTDAFVGVAHEHGRFLVECEGFPREKVHVIPNGVDTARFRPDEDAGRKVRSELGIAIDTPLCGILAALRPEKNHEMFLQTARRICSELADAEFLVIGDGEQRADLQTLARSMGLTERVHFLGTRRDVPQVLASLDVLLLTSHMEANPVSLLEGLAVGLPVVATDVGSVSTTVLEGATGYLVPAGDVEACAQRTAELLRQPALAREFGNRGRQHVVANGSLESMVRGYEQLITSLYARKSGSLPQPSESDADAIVAPIEPLQIS